MNDGRYQGAGSRRRGGGKRGGNGKDGGHGPERRGRRTPPPEQTHEEGRYIKRLKENETPLDVTLADGRVVRCTITYFDREMIKLAPDEGPTIFVRKSDIRTIAEVEASRSS
jgi:hypothetical protein